MYICGGTRIIVCRGTAAIADYNEVLNVAVTALYYLRLTTTLYYLRLTTSLYYLRLTTTLYYLRLTTTLYYLRLTTVTWRMSSWRRSSCWALAALLPVAAPAVACVCHLARACVHLCMCV